MSETSSTTLQSLLGYEANSFTGYFLAVVLLTSFAHAQTATPRPHVLGIAHIAFRVSDMDKAELFYESLGYQDPFSLTDRSGKTTNRVQQG